MIKIVDLITNLLQKRILMFVFVEWYNSLRPDWKLDILPMLKYVGSIVPHASSFSTVSEHGRLYLAAIAWIASTASRSLPVETRNLGVSPSCRKNNRRSAAPITIPEFTYQQYLHPRFRRDVQSGLVGSSHEYDGRNRHAMRFAIVCPTPHHAAIDVFKY